MPVLFRHHESPWGTFGIFADPAIGLYRYTVELPYRDNTPFRSAIPPTVATPTRDPYPCIYTPSPSLGYPCYEITAVPNRKGIRLHTANLARQLLGCVALGRTLVDFGGEWGVGYSDDTRHEIEDAYSCQPFLLTVTYELPGWLLGNPLLGPLDTLATTTPAVTIYRTTVGGPNAHSGTMVQGGNG